MGFLAELVAELEGGEDFDGRAETPEPGEQVWGGVGRKADDLAPVRVGSLVERDAAAVLDDLAGGVWCGGQGDGDGGRLGGVAAFEVPGEVGGTVEGGRALEGGVL